MLPANLSTASRARAVLLAAVASSTVLLGGCATKGDLRNVQTEIRSLGARQDTLMALLRQQSVMTRDTLRTQSSQLVDLRGNVTQQLRQIQEQLQTLQELTGQNQRAIAGVRDQIDAMRRSGSPMGAGGPTDAGEGVEGGDGPDAMYNAAVTQYNRGSWTAARLGFQRFLTAHPRHDLSPRAHRYLAEILVNENRIEEAIAEFERIQEFFPDHQEVPGALYRIGALYIELGDPDQARRYLERVINTYPESDMTPLARERLREIGGARR